MQEVWTKPSCTSLSRVPPVIIGVRVKVTSLSTNPPPESEVAPGQAQPLAGLGLDHLGLLLRLGEPEVEQRGLGQGAPDLFRRLVQVGIDNDGLRRRFDAHGCMSFKTSFNLAIRSGQKVR